MRLVTKNFKRDIIYLPFIGLMFIILMLVLLYRPPSFSLVLVESGFILKTEGSKDLGQSFSLITIEGSPMNTTLNIIPEQITLLLSINTQISKNIYRTSVFSSNLYYNISIILNSKVVDQIIGNYFGSSSEDSDKNIFYAVRLPSYSHPLLKVRDTYGFLNLEFRGGFYNSTDKTLIDEGRSEIRIFKLHPFSRIISFLLLLSIIVLRTIDRNRSINRLKNIWN